MNWKILSLPALVFASSAILLAPACEPCEGDECSFDDGIGGEESGGSGGGEETGGTGSGASPGSGGGETGGAQAGGSSGEAGASSGGEGSGGEAGSGGTGATSADLDCQKDGSIQGTPGSCALKSDPGDPNYDCEACVQMYCCSEFEACNAASPVTACRFGSTLLDGGAVEGEFDCMLTCLRGLDGAFGDSYDVETCAAECGSAECNADHAGPTATALISCMLGIDNVESPLACQEACQMLPQ